MLTLSAPSSSSSGFPILSSGLKTAFFVADVGEFNGRKEWEIFEDLRLFNGNPSFFPPVRQVSCSFFPSRGAALKAAKALEITPLQG